jgi:hypothetical protein
MSALLPKADIAASCQTKRLHGRFCPEHVHQALNHLKTSPPGESFAYTGDFQAGGLASGLAHTFDDVAECLKPQQLHLSRLATFGTE